MDLDFSEVELTPPPKQKSCPGTGSKESDKCDSANSVGRNDDFMSVWKAQKEVFQTKCLLRNSLDSAELNILMPDQKHIADQSWVVASNQGLQCVACHRAGLQGAWAEGRAGRDVKDLRLWFLRGHESRSKSHRQAVKAMIGLSAELPGAPPLVEFQALLKSAMKGSSLRASAEHGCMSDKVQLMHWCLHECVLRRERQAFGDAETVSLCRDARRARLLIRYGLCTSTFQCHAGILGMTKGAGDSSADLVGATRQICEDFFTEYAQPPRWYDGPPAQLNEAALKSACKRVELMMTDAASNELVAGQMSRGHRDITIEAEHIQEPLFPAIKVIGRDHAHGFRRVLQKPYLADTVLNHLMEDMVLSKNAMVQVVHNSFDFQEWLAAEIKLQECTEGFGARARNMKAAKHRFESHSTPLARLLLYLPSFIAVTQRVAQTRSGSNAGMVAADWLSNITPSRLIMLGMLCDAMDEGLFLIRLVDKEDIDLAEIGHHVHNFAERVVWLFIRGNCKACGFTQYVLELLKKGLIVFDPRKGEARRLCSLDDEHIQTSLARMACWTKLALEVLKTEFPDYGVFHAMGLFSVSGLRQGHLPSSQLQDTTQDMARRLAQVFNVNPVGLMEQLSRLRPLAVNMVKNGCDSSKDAWAQVMKKTQHRKSLRASYPASDVLPVLLRYLAWQASTSGLEQTFSRQDRAQTAKSPASVEHEVRAIRLATLSISPEAEKTLCQEAQKLYSECSPGSACRQRGAARVDKDIRRGTRADAESQAAWLKKRRTDVQEGVDRDRQSADLAFPSSMELETWDEGHEEALQKQKTKQAERLLEAYEDNLLLDREITNELKENAASHKAKVARLDATLKKKRQKNEKAASKNHLQLCLAEFHGTVWRLAEDAFHDVSAILMANNISLQNSDECWSSADVLVVRDALEPPEPLAWVAAFFGKTVMEVSAITDNSGLILKFKPVCRRKLAIWMSPQFRQEEPIISSFIRQAVNHRGSKWEVQQRREADALLGTSAEAAQGRDDRWRDKVSMLKEISKLDYDKSGKCGRHR
ncbi:unnamed protein product [Symbiodinium sp. CCMP2592]|nr:unnamed protein product [Symbiodinium sp. CCMP2592]